MLVNAAFALVSRCVLVYLASIRISFSNWSYLEINVLKNLFGPFLHTKDRSDSITESGGLHYYISFIDTQVSNKCDNELLVKVHLIKSTWQKNTKTKPVTVATPILGVNSEG